MGDGGRGDNVVGLGWSVGEWGEGGGSCETSVSRLNPESQTQ